MGVGRGTRLRPLAGADLRQKRPKLAVRAAVADADQVELAALPIRLGITEAGSENEPRQRWRRVFAAVQPARGRADADRPRII